MTSERRTVLPIKYGCSAFRSWHPDPFIGSDRRWPIAKTKLFAKVGNRKEKCTRRMKWKSPWAYVDCYQWLNEARKLSESHIPFVTTNFAFINTAFTMNIERFHSIKLKMYSGVRFSASIALFLPKPILSRTFSRGINGTHFSTALRTLDSEDCLGILQKRCGLLNAFTISYTHRRRSLVIGKSSEEMAQ
jgi:hypothetical protein